MANVPEGDWGSSGRKDTYTFSLVDPYTLADTGEYLEVPYGSASVTYGYYTDNYYSASITTFTEVPPNRLVRIYHHIELLDGTTADETMGTYFVIDSTQTAEQGDVKWDLTCQSTWYRFSGDCATVGAYNGAGDGIDEYVYDIVTSRGGLIRRLDGDAAIVPTSSCEHEPGAKVSEVLNDLMDASSRKMTVDDEGFVVIQYQPDHATQEEAYTFIEGPYCTFKRSYTKSDSNTDKCNRVIALGSFKYGYYFEEESEVEANALSAEAALPESDPFSFQSIGRYVTRVDDYGEVEDLGEIEESVAQKWLQDKAQNALDENSGSIWYIEFEAVGIPKLRHGDVVRYTNYSDGTSGVDERGLVTEISPVCDAGSWSKYKIKVIS